LKKVFEVFDVLGENPIKNFLSEKLHLQHVLSDRNNTFAAIFSETGIRFSSSFSDKKKA